MSDTAVIIRLYGPVYENGTVGPRVPGGSDLPLDVTRAELEILAERRGPGQYVAWGLNSQNRRVAGTQIHITIEDAAKDPTPELGVVVPPAPRSSPPTGSIESTFAGRILESQSSATREAGEIARRVVDGAGAERAAADARLDMVMSRMGEEFRGALETVRGMAGEVADAKAAAAAALASLEAERAHALELARIREEEPALDMGALAAAFSNVLRPSGAKAPTATSDPFETDNRDPFNG